MPKPKTEHSDLAELIAAILAHPDVPEVLYNDMANALANLSSSYEMYENAEVVRAVLTLNAERCARRKGGRSNA